MKFKLSADAVFLADDIDDAFAQLESYFHAMNEDAFESIFIDFAGEIRIFPVREHPSTVEKDGEA